MFFIMQLISISAILLLCFLSTVAIPVMPLWAEDDNIDNFLNLDLSTVSITSLGTDVPTPPPEGCSTGNGSVPVGTAFNDGDCKHCRCIDNGRSECFTIKCPKVDCVDSDYIKGKCCPLCLKGPNCRMPDGSILSKGKKIHLEDMICECVTVEDSWEEPTAQCVYKP